MGACTDAELLIAEQLLGLLRGYKAVAKCKESFSKVLELLVKLASLQVRSCV